MDFFAFATALVSAWNVVSPLIIKLLFALILLLIGLLVARGLEKIAVILLKMMQLDSAADQTGFNELLTKGGIRKKASELVGNLIYWLVALISVLTVAGALGLPIEQVTTKIFSYMGIVFLAALNLGLGIFLAGFISNIVRVVMANLELEAARPVSRLIYYIVIIFSFLVALSELGFNPDWTPHIGVILGAPALAAAIAFGLGCKDMAADFLHNLFKGK
jgi:hypothetical protein